MTSSKRLNDKRGVCLRTVNNSCFRFNYNFIHQERIKPRLLSFCHSVYLCKTGAKTLLFQHFCILYKACLHSLRSIFASFTKHVCKPKHHHLKIVNTPFTKRKHGNYDAQTWYLRCANMPLTKHGMTLTDFTLHFSLTFTKLLYYKFIPLLNNFTMQEKCY